MELRHLRYFVAVAEEENVTRAAARLHVSQPPVSRQIRDLEEELGVNLLERSAKSVRLTEAGRVFLQEARAVLRRADEAAAAARAVASGDSGELRIGYAPSLTVELLPRALRVFHDLAPGIKVSLHDLASVRMAQDVRARDLDAALSVRVSAAAMRGLKFDKLVRFTVCVAAHPTHPLANKRHATLEDVAADRLIAYSREDYPDYHDWIAQLYAKQPKQPVVSEEHDGVTSLIAAVEAGRGVAFAPDILACLAGDRLRLLPLKPPVQYLDVGVLTRREPPKPQLQKFLTAVKAAVSESKGHPQKRQA